MSSKYHKIFSLFEIHQHLIKGAWVFFDIDNTLISSNHFGSEKWEKDLVKEFRKQEQYQSTAYKRASLFWQAFQMVASPELIEKKLLTLFQELQGIGIPYFLITARSQSMATITETQLLSLGIELPERGEADLSLNTSLAVLWKNGVIYCGDTPKGLALQNFLLYKKVWPQKILVVDDRRDNLNNIRPVLNKLKIPFCGLHADFSKRSRGYKRNITIQMINRALVNKDSIRLLLEGLTLSDCL